ncbi:MAG: hypothetical protein NT086_09005 [Proteobacteria bacterium]|nr:hypothetical protein [Pseudomonadota bacterium]
MPGTQTIAEEIHAASLLAQAAMNELDAETLAALLAIYQQAADDIEEQITAAAINGDVVALSQLPALREQITQKIDRVAKEKNQLLDKTLPEAAALGSSPFKDQQSVSRINHDAVRFVHEFRQADGLRLSDRLWRVDRGAKDRLLNDIELAIIHGHSAQQTALEMLARGESGAVDGIDAAKHKNIAKAARDLLTGEGGSAYYNAARVFRTELNRAHGTAYQSSAELTPGCIGTRFLLSPRHKHHDVCDSHASANLYGLGKGVYPHGKNPWPAHPNTLSYVVAVFK